MNVKHKQFRDETGSGGCVSATGPQSNRLTGGPSRQRRGSIEDGRARTVTQSNLYRHYAGDSKIIFQLACPSHQSGFRLRFRNNIFLISCLWRIYVIYYPFLTPINPAARLKMLTLNPSKLPSLKRRRPLRNIIFSDRTGS